MDIKTPLPRRQLARAAIGTALGLATLAELFAATPRSATPKGGVSFIVYLPTRPEQRERMRKMMFDVFKAMTAEPDFVHAWIHEDLNDPDMIVNYETWDCSREYFLEHHLKRPYRQAFEAAVPELLSSERRIVFLKTVRAYPVRAFPERG